MGQSDALVAKVMAVVTQKITKVDSYLDFGWTKSGDTHLLNVSG